MAEPAENVAIVELLYQRLADAAGREAKALAVLEKVAAERDDARTRADAFAKELTEIAEVLPLRPMLLSPDGTVTPTGPDRPARQVRAIVAERDKLRAQHAAALDLASDMHDLIHTASHTPNGTWGTVAEFIAARLRRALGMTDE